MFSKYLPEDISVLSVNYVFMGGLEPGLRFVKSRPDSGFIYLLSGGAVYSVGSRSFTVGEDDIFYLAEGENYSINVFQTPYRFIHINFSLSPESQDAFQSDVCMHNGRAACLSKFQMLRNLYTRREPMVLFSCRTILYELFRQFLDDARKYLSSGKYIPVRRAVEYMEAQYADPALSMETIAGQAGVSTGYLRRLFREFHGVSPVRYLQDLRINRAKELLLSENCTVTDAASRCGYGSLYYFSEAFRARTGVTPSAFRERKYL